MSEMVHRNIDLEMPRDTDQILGTLAHLRGVTKKSVVREALIEYVKNHADDVQKLLRRNRSIPKESSRG